MKNHPNGDINAPWQLYVPTITGTAIDPTLATARTLLGRFKKIGKTLHIAFSYYAVAVTGAAIGSGAYKFGLPDGYEIDTTAATIVANPLSIANNKCGFAESIFGFGVAGNANSITQCIVVGSSLTTVSLAGTKTSNSGDVDTLIGSAAFPMNATTGVYYKFTAEIPIL